MNIYSTSLQFVAKFLARLCLCAGPSEVCEKLPYSSERIFKHDLDNRLTWSWEKMAKVYIKELPVISVVAVWYCNEVLRVNA